MKSVLKFFAILFCVIAFLPVLFYSTIAIINNCIANNIEKNLVAAGVPESTQIVDSISIAGKIFGNGNGMQYFGAMLVTSELTQEELEGYYKQINENYCVEKKEDNFVINQYLSYAFSSFVPDKDNYMIWCMDHNSEKLAQTENFLYELLDFDIRGH